MGWFSYSTAATDKDPLCIYAGEIMLMESVVAAVAGNVDSCPGYLLAGNTQPFTWPKTEYLLRSCSERRLQRPESPKTFQRRPPPWAHPP